MKRVVFLVGASGAGKTTVARILEQRAPWEGHTHYFDSIGVPSAEAMDAKWGGGEAWQEWATRAWIDQLAQRDAALQLIEGQTRPSFIRAAAEHHPELQLHIILLDCSPEVRRRRLVELRGSPELATPRMDSWAAYLAGQAHALGLPVVVTDSADPHETAAHVEALLMA